MLILNCGGTFNKRYNKLTGELEVPFDNKALERILQSAECVYDLGGAIYKDSLDMDKYDRETIANIIKDSDEDKFIIIHGTDTIHQTAELLDEIFENKTIILTGSMKPFEIDNIEATLNIGMSFGFINSSNASGVYICMNGFVKEWNKLKKNRDLGKFELVE